LKKLASKKVGSNANRKDRSKTAQKPKSGKQLAEEGQEGGHSNGLGMSN